jgi:hypothetical protein
MKRDSALYYILRITCAMCFIGHGSFGVITKPVWCNYFAVFGIGKIASYQLMPIVGVVDILLGLILLFYPLRFAAVWLVIWGLFTAVLRPLSGESIGEVFERAGNYGTPFILLMLCSSPPAIASLWQKLDNPKIENDRDENFIRICMQVFSGLLLAGHAWLNLSAKESLVKQYSQFGFSDPFMSAKVIGALELLGALIIIVKPVKEIVLVLLFWKMASELLYPAYRVLEWVERGGSYGLLLGLFVYLRTQEKRVLPQNAALYVS